MTTGGEAHGPGVSWQRRLGVSLAALALAGGDPGGVQLGTGSAGHDRQAGIGLPGGGGRVVLVGTFDGHAGQYRSIQSAVDAARRATGCSSPPGDYHETDDNTHPPECRPR